ncbi:hypothetical protein [Actinotalea fermentans]|uniref:Zinc-ribbon 15 domain-containing protein n=1 Tax=Actinotalea fermentans TaxID=43671 RepID=A0A511Z283_9CELL|nr:hypothetical protein [Actinotalea fermentans]KGM15225.1 hypothetical protein N867_10710 [Actinotalea fermentans ATCC 43279 = JCM 9966 = DSM 3133]GEN81562.1 hypothetical protein AFE02nite_32960 [Actinotalea fermentans]
MILFFGTRLRRRVLGVGTFDCPHCAVVRAVERVASRVWAHLFWIPLFPLGTPRVSLQCTACHGEWPLSPGGGAGAVGGLSMPQA